MLEWSHLPTVTPPSCLTWGRREPLSTTQHLHYSLRTSSALSTPSESPDSQIRPQEGYSL
ncbi:hypothetical protein E2C01_022929 [Portunus trituberculatus]|uniref:Uncharacterized protein n=1 Tax=Portunus trituberculatus TaxID=210409 RepID=A0A5B7E9U1_PORTR|nr:hypothetical protein [Portunus trituberculatus]